MNDQLLKRVIAVIPVPDQDLRLKKTVLLRAIESEISEAVVTDKLLEIFEMIEQLDKNEGVEIMESMKAAYCAVAVECTVKFLLPECTMYSPVGDIDKHGRYSNAVRRIWRGRVTELQRCGKSELVSRELKAWKDEIEASFCDKNVRKTLMKMNTRYDALKLTTDYLGEAWAVLGPSFLQLSASLMDNRTVNEMQSVQLEQEINKTAAVSEDVGGGNCGIELHSEMENSARPEREGSGQVTSQVEMKGNSLLNTNQGSGVDDGSKQSTTVAINTERVQELASGTAEGQESAEKEVAVLHNQSPTQGGTD